MSKNNAEVMDSDGFEHVTQPLEDIKEEAEAGVNGKADDKIVGSDAKGEKKDVNVENTGDKIDGKESAGEGDTKAIQPEALKTAPEDRPTWTRMHLRHLSVEVLKQHKIDYIIDAQDPDYVVIQRWVPEYEQDFLWAATRALRTKRNAAHRGSDSQYPSRVRFDRASSPGVIEMRRSDRGAELQLEINRIEFKDWASVKYTEQRRKHVLDVAVQDGRPMRVAINSEVLRDELRIVIGAGVGLEISEWRRVLTGPWKVLVEYEQAIRQRLQKLERLIIERDEKGTGQPVESREKQPDQVFDNRPEVCEVRARDPPSSCEVCDVVFPPHETPLECLDTRLAHLKCLVQFMDSDLKHVFELRQQIKDGSLKEIAFADLWHLFNPGDLIVTSPLLRAYRVFHTSGGRPRLSKPDLFEKKTVCSPFNINCFYMEYDWKTVGPIHETLRISEYVGKKLVTELLVELDAKLMTERVTVCPIKMLSLDEKTKQISYLVSRGQKLRSLKQGDHKYYIGHAGEEQTWDDDDPRFARRVAMDQSRFILDVKKEREFIESAVIIDNEMVKVVNKAIGIFDAIEFDSRETAENCTHYGVSNNQYVNDRYPRDCRCSDMVADHVVDNDRAAKYKDDLHLLQAHGIDDELDHDYLMLLPPTIEGFVLEKKKWKMLNVDAIHDLKEEGEEGMAKQIVFEDLVLPEGHESLLKALVGAHPSSNPSNVEVNKRSSNLSILLHGPRSTGKFLTMKALASYFNRPLYTISHAEFGFGTWDAARELAVHFKRAAKWNCIIAIPEAEYQFPYRKTPQDGDSSVSRVLLREIELFKGIVILTTNSKEDLDEQVVRGMSVCLGSDFWSKEDNIQVWHKVLKNRQIQSTMFEKEAYSRWLEFIDAEYKMGKRWNGAEINNYFDTALAMAEYGTEHANISMPLLKSSHLSIAAGVAGASVFSVL